MSNINSNCPCPNTGCERHGNCEACKKNHNGETFCKRAAAKALEEESK